MYANPKHHWDVSTMTVKEALASWKGKALKTAMDKEIRSLIGMGAWELVERLPRVNIMKNRWVLITTYHIDDTVEREMAKLVMKGFTQVYGTDYDETYAPVSSTQFAATTTRPDIALARSKLGSSLMVRRDQHWREVDRCLTYLASTRDTALGFGVGPESLKFVSYVDANNAGDKQNRTSTGGYVFVYGGAAVSWSSRTGRARVAIKCATLSLTESEYVTATKAGKEGRRLRFLLVEFQQLDVRTPTVLRVDNKSAITVAEGLGSIVRCWQSTYMLASI
ncbi:unnamed protein product [Closterium sp. NIES-54]